MADITDEEAAAAVDRACDVPAQNDHRQLHDRLRDLLPLASAETCQIVATFLDIRGFSKFSATGESFDSALYLRSVYGIVLATHFADASFFKPTGDGLLIVHELPTKAQEVPVIVSSILGRLIGLVNSFGEITANDLMINFDVPQELGVGVARGSATRLVSDGFVLDYTGRCLNLAARLMDKARPSGVVFSDRHATQLIDTDLADSFSKDRVCIRGISEQTPIEILLTDGVRISPADREPLPESKNLWGTQERLTLSELRESSQFSFYLPRAPRSFERAGVHVEFPSFDKEGNDTGWIRSLELYGEVAEHPQGTVVIIPLKRVHEGTKTLPPTIITKILGRTKPTYVTFTSFCAPLDEA